MNRIERLMLNRQTYEHYIAILKNNPQCYSHGQKIMDNNPFGFYFMSFGSKEWMNKIKKNNPEW